MSGKRSSKRGVLALGATFLMVVGVLAVFAGSASAAPTAPAASATASWAYGGENATNGTVTVGNLTATWSVSVDAVVVFNATPNGPNVTELQAERTIGVTIAITLTSPAGSIAYNFRGTEHDDAYANVTNASRVYVGGLPVAALGLENSAFHGSASLAESLVAKGKLGKQLSAYLNVSATAEAAVSFAPALGLVPLDLSGVTAWNSSATASPSANWDIDYAYAFHGWNNSSAGGSGTRGGSWSASGPISLHGQVITVSLPRFRDHVARTGVLLTVSGPATLYDGFVLIPRGYDLFGGASHDYSNDSMSNVTISGETLFLTKGRIGVGSFSATRLSIGGQQGRQPLAAGLPAVTSDPTGTVVEQPESPSAAQSQAHCIEFGCAGSAPWFSGLVALVVVGALIAAVVGTVGVVEWRSYARRKNRSAQLIGGYGESMAHGLPPAGATAPAAPQSAPNGPSNDLGSGRVS